MMDSFLQRSENDQKEYKIFILDCGLECLLISTKERDIKNGNNCMKAAAAMAVQVGSFADPEYAGGCAHFLEHMLFLGSKRYPIENAYDSFITSHGGSCNAFTEGEYTVYQFDINENDFIEALPIFADCFISPLLDSHCVDREIIAIENEFNIARNSDSTRIQQLLCYQATNNPTIQKFSWGNLDSLSIKPKEAGIDMNKVLKAFHASYYTPQNMKLVVIASKGMNEIESIVCNSFNDWNIIHTNIELQGRNNELCNINTSLNDVNAYHDSNNMEDLPDAKKPKLIDSNEIELILPSIYDYIDVYKNIPLYTKETLQHVLKVIPIKNTHKLILTWQLPAYRTMYRSKPFAYISHLLGHEGPGSILSTLKHYNLATSVSAGVSDSNIENNEMFSIFEISILLTEKGLANWIYVEYIVHQYLHLLRSNGPDKRIFDELKTMGNIYYKYLDEEEPSDYVERLSVDLLPIMNIARDHLLSNPFLYWDWDPNTVIELLQVYMIPRKAKHILLSSGYKTKEKHSSDANNLEPILTTASMNNNNDNNNDINNNDIKEEENEYDLASNSNNGNSSDDADDDETDEADEADVDNEEEKEEELYEIDYHNRIKDLYIGPPHWLNLVLPPSSSETETSRLLCISCNIDINNTIADAAAAADDNIESIKLLHAWFQEPYFGTEYSNDNIPEDLYLLWEESNLSTSFVVAPDSSSSSNKQPQQQHISILFKDLSTMLYLPPANLYIPNQLDMIITNNDDDLLDNKDSRNEILDTIANNNNRNNIIDDVIIKEYQNVHLQYPYPTKIIIQSGIYLWYLQDLSYLTPKSEIYCNFISNYNIKSIKNSIILDIISQLLKDTVNEELYMASMGELNCHINTTDISIIVKISGFSDKSCLLMERVLHMLFNILLNINIQSYNREIEELLRKYENSNKQAHQIATNSRLLILNKNKYSTEEKLNYLQKSLRLTNNNDKNHDNNSDIDKKEIIDIISVQQYIYEFYTHLYLDFYVQGNIKYEHAVTMIQTITNNHKHHINLYHSNTSFSTITTTTTTTNSNNMLQDYFSINYNPNIQTFQIPMKHMIIVDVIPTNIKETNSCIEVYYQLGPWNLLEQTKLDVLEQLLIEPFFDSLRTKQQLGYAVSCGVRQTHGILGFCYKIVSSKYNVEDLLMAIFKFVSNLFIDIFNNNIINYNNNILAFQQNCLLPSTSLSESASKHWSQIEDKTYYFNQTIIQSKIINYQNLINYDIMKEFCNKLFFNEPKILIIQSTRKEIKIQYNNNTEINNLYNGCKIYHMKNIEEIHKLF